MNQPFWTTLAQIKDRKDTLSGWQFFFGAQYDALRPFLLVCPGEYATSYLHPGARSARPATIREPVGGLR